MGPCESMNVFIHVQKCKNCEITCKKSDLSIEINSCFPHQICMNWTCIWIMEPRKKENTGNGNFSGSHFPIQIYCLHSHKLARQPIARLLIWQPISSKYFVLKDDFFSSEKKKFKFASAAKVSDPILWISSLSMEKILSWDHQFLSFHSVHHKTPFVDHCIHQTPLSTYGNALI